MLTEEESKFNNSFYYLFYKEILSLHKSSFSNPKYILILLH